MKSEITRANDGTITLKITVAWTDVEKARQKVLEELAKQVELPGFRKGTAPGKLVAEKLGKAKINEETLKKLLPSSYVDAIKLNGLNPIIHPKIHVETFDDGTDLKFTAETCEEPSINLKNYKDEVKKITAKSKIIIPHSTGSLQAGSGEEKKPPLDEIIQAILVHSDVVVSKVLIEQEANRLLSGLLDELKNLGLSLDQYLVSRNKTAESLRAEYEEKARQDIKLEFVLRKIAEDEKITVDQKDIDEAIGKVKDEQQRAELSKNPYVVASIIRQQKTLDYLSKI